MSVKLRYYQEDAVNSAIDWVKKSTQSCVLELPTGAGKSLICAEIAIKINQLSKGKHVLLIVPSLELLQQNAEKIKNTGNEVSLFSASAGETCLKHSLVVGTPMSIKNQLDRFGSQFAAVIIDEAHKVSNTIEAIIEQMKVFNENLRVIGLSATPYKTFRGYIFKHDLRGVALHESKTRDPYFDRLIYKITARELIQQGYLCQPIVGAIHSKHYETLNMQTNAMGKFSKDDIDKAYHGKGRLTAEIVADVIEQSRDRKGVLFFAATIQHAGEVMESLPPELSAIVTGSTPAREREIILLKFKAQILKYLVNVSVLTTGFDSPHCSVVAILRATESAALLQQIIGRSLRLSDGKQNALILDYAENIERHCPDGDFFNPNIKTSNSVEFDGEYLIARCPDCGLLNETKPRDNDAGFGIDDNGYFVDLQRNRIVTEYGFFPAHHSRSCQSDYCDYKWSFKPCHECGHENDVAARYCGGCKEELIDPNEKLVRQYRERKSDPYQMQTDEVLDMKVKPTISKAGNECLRVEFTTAWRTFTVFFTPVVKRNHDWFMSATKNGTQFPETVTYQKVGDFYKIYNYNARVLNDEIPPMA